jgi:hypothetical protein
VVHRSSPVLRAASMTLAAVLSVSLNR